MTTPSASTETFKAIRLDSKNYESWRIQITSILKAKLLYKYCNEQTVILNEADMAKNEAAKSIILTTMSAELISSYGDCETAFDMWQKIKTNYQGSAEDYKYGLLRDFFGIRCKENDIEQYTSRFLEKVGQLAAISYTITEDTKVCIYMQGLMNTRFFKRADTWQIANKTGKLTSLIAVMRSAIEAEPKGKESVALMGTNEKDKKTKNNKKILSAISASVKVISGVSATPDSNKKRMEKVKKVTNLQNPTKEKTQMKRHHK